MTAFMYLGGDPTKVDASGYTFGDILAADPTGTLEPVTVGADGFVLTADSVAPEGVDYQAGGGGGGGSPSNTVVTETAFGQGSTAGALVTFSRGDHTHGTPAAPTVPSPAASVITEQAFGQLPAVGTGVTYARNDHTHGTPAAPAGSTLVVRRARVMTGDVPLNLGSGAWNLIPGFTLALPAVIGDYVELGVAFMTQSGNAFLDLAVVVSAAAVRYNSTDTNTPALEGAPWLYKDANVYRTAIMPWGFQVVSGDLSGGNVTFGVAMKGTTGTLYSSTNYPFFWIAKNYGAANVA